MPRARTNHLQRAAERAHSFADVAGPEARRDWLPERGRWRRSGATEAQTPWAVLEATPSMVPLAPPPAILPPSPGRASLPWHAPLGPSPFQLRAWPAGSASRPKLLPSRHDEARTLGRHLGQAAGLQATRASVSAGRLGQAAVHPCRARATASLDVASKSRTNASRIRRSHTAWLPRRSLPCW